MKKKSKNLGFKTDLIFLENDGEIVNFPNYTIVRTPHNPSYYFGNFLLLNNPPNNNKKKKLEINFDAAFKATLGVNHYTFCWNNLEKTDISAYIKSGYVYSEQAVLTATFKDLIAINNRNKFIEIRPFNSEEDWLQWINLEIQERDIAHSETGYRKFILALATQYKKLSKYDKGNFYGAFLNQELVATAGLFYKEKIGRFQKVLTKSAYRKQGICKTLIYKMCAIGFKSLDTLVIVAEKDSPALKIYKNLGFKYQETQFSLCWWK